MKSRSSESMATLDSESITPPIYSPNRQLAALQRLLSSRATKYALATAVALDVLTYSNLISNPLSKNSTTTVEVSGSFPKRIPGPVLDRLGNVVAVRGNLPKYTEIGSGVFIGANKFLSAGHMVDKPNDTPLNGIEKCGTLQADTANGIERGVKNVASFNAKDNSIPDISIIQTAGSYTYPKVSLNTTTPFIGEPLYFANYEPTPSGSLRDPLSPNYSLSHPAFYGGVVNRVESNGDIDVVTGLIGYNFVGSNLNDSHSRGGASGGPVFNASGQLEGTVIALSEWGRPKHHEDSLSVSNFDVHEDIKLTNTPSNIRVQETIIQPISPSLLTHLGTELNAANYCSK